MRGHDPGETAVVIDIQQQVPLKDFNSWQVGGAAQFYVAPKDTKELQAALRWSVDNKIKYQVLGAGSNVLIADEGVAGLVIHTCLLQGLTVAEQPDKIRVTALAGTLKSDVLKVFMKYRLAPAVFLAGLPGDIGGGVVMNAGIGLRREPREFCEIVESVTVFRVDESGESTKFVFHHDQLDWQYRHCYGWQPGVISEVTLAWPNQPDDKVLAEVRDGNKRRRETQPLNWPSGGSTFKNPPNGHAGALIEQAGLKGFTIGGAQVSEKHANFIINKGEATAKDIVDVIRHVQKVVKEKFGVTLTTEVVLLS